MSTKTTFKRIALVAVASLGFGVLSVVPSQAEVSGLLVTPTNGTGAMVGTKSDSTTAATLNVQFLALNTSGNAADSVTVQIVEASALPTGAAITDLRLFFTESTTSVTTTPPTVDTNTSLTAANSNGVLERRALPYSYQNFRVIAPVSAPNATSSVKIKVSVDSASAVAGTYSLNAIVKSLQGGVTKTDVVPFSITVAAIPAAAVKVPSAKDATAILEAGDPGSVTTLTDSVTVGSFAVSTAAVGVIKVSNFDTAGAAASDTITATITGPGYLKTASDGTGRSLILTNKTSIQIQVMADGTSGVGTITITTVAGASFVKKVTFYDTKPSKAVATVAKAYIKAGTGEVADVFSVKVTDSSDNAIKSTGASVTAAPTDTATTVGGAATCAWSAADDAYMCAVKGLSATKFGPVAYTITATGSGTNLATKVTTSATVTFADNVATKAVLAGPASAAPGAEAEYTITLTEKNGYPVADQVYGDNSGSLAPGGVLFAKRVATGWSTAPFATTESFTAKSGVITSKGTMPLAGTATGTWTLAGDGIATATTDAIDKTIGKTTLTASTEVANAAADAATAAAEAAEAAAQDATDAALDATTAAEAAGALAQEAVDAVAELSAEVTKLMAGVKAQITYLTKLVMRLAAK